jgi:hypothetical protein
MVDVRMSNSQAPWADFSSEVYYDHNYKSLAVEDQEILQRVSLFFADAFADRDRAEYAIDVGSGGNLYPALLMLPWTNHMLLTDYSPHNVKWLDREVGRKGSPWLWEPFWQELKDCKGYDEIDEPRGRLRKSCHGDSERAGIRWRSIFDLPEAQWGLGTMFFLAESITEDADEFQASIGKFVGALQPGAPFAAAFMAESTGYEVGGTRFPATPVSSEQVRQCFGNLGVNDLTVNLTQTPPEVRDGYKGIVLATGIVASR